LAGHLAKDYRIKPFRRTPLFIQFPFACSPAKSLYALHNSIISHLTMIRMKTHAQKPATDVYQIITNLIIEKLEQGVIPWKKPWSSFGPAANYLTRKPYRGINQLLLNSLAHTYPYYLTFHQAGQLGGKVRKGAKAFPVTYWNFVYHHASTGRKITEAEARLLPAQEVLTSAFLRYYSVFNVADVEGIDFQFPQPGERSEITINAACEQIIRRMPLTPRITHQGHEAYYSPATDTVNMPPMPCFNSAETYYSVLFHELTHATGHAKRLARPEVIDHHRFGSTGYSREELTAEMGACFLSGFAGIQTEQTLQDSAGYINGWLQQLRNDKTFLLEAAGKAQKAADYILITPDN
jgi:antirestriction protein ArdC